jgi:hypothetical protein
MVCQCDGLCRDPEPAHRNAIPRFTNDRFPYVRKIRQFLLVSVTFLGVSIHHFGWHFAFPTRAERIIWRDASLQMLWIAAFFWAAEILAGLHPDQTWELLYIMIFQPSRLTELKRARKARPARPQPTPETFLLPWECGVSMTMWLLYLIARLYVLVEMEFSVGQENAKTKGTGK